MLPFVVAKHPKKQKMDKPARAIPTPIEATPVRTFPMQVKMTPATTQPRVEEATAPKAAHSETITDP